MPPVVSCFNFPINGTISIWFLLKATRDKLHILLYSTTVHLKIYVYRFCFLWLMWFGTYWLILPISFMIISPLLVQFCEFPNASKATLTNMEHNKIICIYYGIYFRMAYASKHSLYIEMGSWFRFSQSHYIVLITCWIEKSNWEQFLETLSVWN